jgi:hypothetical protein
MRPLALAAIAILTVSTSADAQRRNSPTFTRAASTTSTFDLESSEPLAHLLSADCDTDRERGREAAGSAHSGAGWMGGGLLSGVVLGLIGTGVIWAMATSSTAQPDRVPDGVESACYRAGYSARAKSINTSSALTGGLIGTAVFLVLVLSATSGSTY